MNIYIDESGSINNHCNNNKHFIIALVHVTNKKALQRAYSRFISSNHKQLLELDQDKINPYTGKVLKQGNKMFKDGKFIELKGSQLSPNMKRQFVTFFCKKQHFNLFYIKIDNSKLTDAFCSNTARVFNFTTKLALGYYIQNSYLPDEDCNLQLDERNEKTQTTYFLENYLNTELKLGCNLNANFNVQYFDSANNKLIQVADVFANLYYSQLLTSAYTEEFKMLESSGILKHCFNFPL